MRSIVLVGVGALGTASTLRAQEDLRPIVEELREKNSELEGRLDALETGSDADATHTYGLTANYQDVRATFQLFGDAGFGYHDPSPRGLAHSSFTIGTIDAFLTAQMGDHLQVLSETVLTSGASNDTQVAQERLWGAWTFDDRLYAKLGLEHSPLTRWNRRYHHGSWLQPTIARPLLSDFEGNPEGFLPLHNSGLELGGRTALAEAGNLDYALILSNGRGPTPDDKQKSADANDSKAVVGSLGFSPAGNHLHVGIAAHFDVLPADAGSTTPALTDDVDQRIGSAFVETTLAGAEIVGEFAAMRDETNFDGETYDHYAWYVQVLVPLAPWTPYARFDVKDMDHRDPYLGQLDRDLDQWRQTIGVRNDFATNAAFKLELGFGDRDRRSVVGSVISEESFFTIAFQLSWVV